MHISVRLNLTEEEYRYLLAEAQRLVPGCADLEPRELALVVQGMCKFYFDEGLKQERQRRAAHEAAAVAA